MRTIRPHTRLPPAAPPARELGLADGCIGDARGRSGDRRRGYPHRARVLCAARNGAAALVVTQASRNSYAPVRRYRNVQIKAGGEILTAVEPQSDDVSEALTKISNAIEH